MTSTNDGKEVKSNQISGPKGKTYFIELFRSLDSRLTEACSASERTKHLCEAWRRVHNLCLHSTSSAHTHLLSWLQRHTARTILQTGWQLPDRKDERASLAEAINVLIVESHTAATIRDGVSPAWETHLVSRGEWFKKVLDSPWQHPVLTCLLNPNGTPPTDDEVLEWLKEERGVTLVVRLQTLVAEKQCDDIAVSLATAVMERTRRDSHHSDVEQSVHTKDKPKETGPSFEERLKEEAGFTVDVLEMLTDIEFMLLHKRDSSRCITLAKQTPLPTAYKLIERLQSRLETSPREKRLWKNSKEVAVLIAQVVIARCMVIQQCAGVVRGALYRCAHLLARLMPSNRLPSAAAALAAPAPTAAHLHTLAAAIDAQIAQKNETSMKPFVCELYVRAITAGMNELERLKLKTEKDTEARSMEQTLASWFVQLGAVLACSNRFKCECALTAFSVHPSPQMYETIKSAPPLMPIHLESIEQASSEAANPEFGSWASDSRSQTNFVKTSETLNMKARQNQANVLSTAILNEGEALGLSPELCQDITVLLSGPRVKTLSWDMDRELLLENCRAYLERTHGGTKAVTTELKYLNLNPADFQYLPEEDEDENNIYYGIEKGYEHLVEPVPEDIWEDAYEHFETADTTYSSDEFDFIQPQRKKKTKKQVVNSEEDDPLSYIAEIKRKKERPHSKERKEKKKTDKLLGDKKIPGDPLDINVDSPDMKKDKPKKERKKKIPKPDGLLSSLVGLKVSKSRKIINCDVESDIDSQGKSPMQSTNSEDNVLYDGVFSMDEMRSPRSSHSTDSMGQMQNIELAMTNRQVGATHTHQSLISRTYRPQIVGNLRIESQSYIPQSPSVHSRNNSPTHISDDVKCSISKLLEFRRMKALECERKKPKTIIRPEGPMAIDSNISPKGVAIPEIPKSYINKQQSELLIKKQRDDLLAQRKERYAAIPSPVIQYASRNCNPGHVRQPYYNGPSEYNTTLNDRMTPSSDRCFSTPPMDKSDRFLNSVSLVSIYDKNEPCQSRNFPVKSPYSGIPNENADINYQDYLHEFYKHSAYNQYAEKKEPTKKVIRPTNRITPVVPNIKSEQKTPQCAKQMPQKKPDGSLNTFSRLSYYKNKQTDMRNRAQDMAQTNQSQTVGSKLDGFIMEHLNQSQFIDKKSPSIDAQAFERVYEKPQSTSREHPIIANILLGNLSQAHQQHAVPPQKTILSEKDQNDLVLLLRQQSLLNKPKVPLASCSKSILSTHNNLEASCAKTTSSTETYVSNPNSMPSNLSNTTTSPSNMHSNSNNMTSNPKIMSPNSSHMSRNPQICIMPLTPNNMPSNPQIRLMPTNPQTGKPNEIKKMNEKKMINIISTSILKSADSTKDPKPKPVNTKKPTCQEKHKKTESKVQKQNSAKSAVTVQKHPKEWENVMNAILKQKTPCRGPNALDMALNKSSFEKAFEESLRKPASCFEPPSTTDSVSSIEYNHEQYVKITKSRTTSSTSVTTIINTEKKTHTVVKTEIRTPRKYSKSKKSAVNKVEKMMKQHQIEPKVIQKLMQQKQIEISQKNSNISRIEIPETILKESSTTKLKTATQLHVDMPKIQTNFKPKDTRHIIDTPKKMVRQVIEPSKDAKYLEANKKEPMKQFTCAGPEQDDTCVSGIPNSDYDLLDELMDDDLRKEIGELSSDEESYNATAQDFPKENDKTDKKPINVVYNHQINDILTKASPHVSLRSVCKQNEMASSYSQKPTQQQPNNKEPTPVAAVKSAQNKPVMCLNATNVNVTTHIVTEPTQVRTYNSAVLHSTQITGQPNIYIAAVPRPNPVQNVMLIPSDLVYDGYSSVQTPIQSATNAYMNNAPAINVYQTTQFTAPVLNPIIVANAVTDPVIITPSVTVVKSKPERNANQSLYPPKDELQQPIHLATSQGNIVVDGNKLDAKVSSSVPNYDTESDMLRKHADINLNKNCERIVLKEVQEKQTVEKIDCERIRKVSEKALKIQADQERLRKKRLAILNREINYLCGVETIALSYSPLQPSNPIAEKEDDVVDKKEESTFNNEKTPATLDCYKENENEPEPVRRILLRSSNKLKNNIISPATSPKPPLDRKLKALPTNSLDKTENGTPSENDLTDIEMNLKQKRISTRIRNQSVTTPKYTKNNETKVASKVPNKRTTGTQRIRQKNKSDKNPDAVKDTTSNQDFDTEQFFDIEAELLGSTIPKIIPITTHCPSPYDACTPITIAEDIEQSLITDKEEDTSLLIQKNQQQEKYLPLNRTTLLTEHCDSLIESSDDTVTDSNTVDVIEQTIKIKDNVSEASGESVLSSVRVINKEKEKDMNDRVLKEIISQATEPVSKSIKANSQNNEVKISSQVNGPDKDLITKQPSPVEIDNPLTLKNFPNILINKKAQANEIKSVKDSSVKADNSNIKDIHCQNKSACKKMDLNKSSKIIAPQAAKNDVRTTVTLPPQLNSRKLNSPNKFNKNSIVIENVTNPDETNPLKKTVRIKLANGKIFKGTVSGSADIDTLLEDPQVKALLMSQFEQPKKLYTLKLNVNKDIFNGKRVLSTHILDKPTPQAPLETVSLLSDDEDEESPQAFITEFGKHKINSMDHNIFTKHQNKLNLKCHVLVNKLSMEENAISCRSDTKLMDNVSSNLPTQQECVIIDNANPKHQISLASSSMFVEKIDEVNVLSTIPSKYVQGIFNDIENILAPSKNIPIVEPIVLIDDSSNDSVDDNKKPEPKEKIVELKNMLLKDLGVINNSLPATTESTGDVQVTCVSEAIDLTGDLVMEPAVCSDKEKLSTLVNYQDIINRKYVVKLVRCDYMVSQSSKKSKPIEEEDDELMKPNVRPAPISRSSSFSLLEDFPDVDKISEYKIERNSPVMEVYEAIAPLNCKIPIINKHKMVTPLKCVSEWMSTKKMSKILSMNDLGRQVTSQSFIVPNLATLVLDLIQKGDLLEKYNLVPKIHTTPISLKRKLNPSTIPAAKISKMVNLQNEPQNNNCSLASTITYGWSADASIVPLNDVYDDNNLNAEIKEKPKIDSLDITPKLLDTNMTEFDMEDVTLIRNETGHEESKVINPLGENIPMTTILENSNKSGAVVYSDGNETVLAVTETQEKNINHSLDISFVSPKHHSVQLTAAHLPIDSAETSPDPDNDIPIDCSNIDFSKTNVDENCAPILMAIDSEIDSTGQIEIEDDSKNMSANSQWFPKPECMAKDSAIEVPRETSAETSPGGEPDDDIPIDCSSIDFGMEQFEENNVPISIHNSEVSPAHVEIEDDNINKMLAISESVVTTKSMVENTDQLISDADVSVCFATKISRSEILSVDIIEGLNNGVSTTQKNRNKYEPTITIEELSGSTTTKDIDKNIVVLKPISEVEDSIAKDVIGTNNSEKDNSNKGTQKIAESNEGMSVLHNSKIYKGSSEEIVYQSKNPRTLAVSKRDNLKTTTAAQKPDDIIYSDKANGKQVIKISCELQLEKCEFLDDHESANVEENRDNGLASMAEVCTENNYKTNAVIENETLGGDEKHMFEASEDIDEHHKNKALYSSNNEHDKSCTEHKEMCNLDLAISINSAKFAKGHETDNVTIMLENKKSSKLFKDCDRNNTENERSAKKLNAMNLPQTTDEIYDALHKMFGESESSQDSTDVCEIKMRINSAGNHHIDAINASLREGLALMDDSDNEILVESVVDMLSDEIIEDIAVSALASTSDVAIQTEHENLINISDSKLYSDDMNDENSASFELNAQNMLGKYINLTSEKELKVDTIQTEFENLTNIGNSKLYSDEINDENRKSIELNAKNMLGKYLNSTMEKVPQVDMKGVVSEDPEIATVFSIIDNCNDQTIEDIKLLVPKHTYTKYLATEMFRRSGRNLKRKKNMSDIKTSEKKYRKGKNIDNPKSAIAEFAYSNEYKRIINYCNTIKFSYARPFHIDYIDVHKMHKAWPIQTCHTFEIKELSNVEEVLFTDTVDTENAIALTDPMKQTLNEEIMNGNNLTDYKSIDINEINFSMGFGERSGRVIQKIETGNTKLSAATLSDVKQYQPFSKSEVSKINLNITHEKETQNVDLSRFTNLISMKEKVRAIFKKTAVELHNDLLQDKKYDTNYCHLSSLFDLTSTEYLNVPRMETVVNVVQVGQLAVSTAAQNPVTCDPRVTHVSDASPSQCSENSPGEDPQATLETEYTELTTANITLPIVQEYSQHQTTHTEEQISPETDDDPNGSTQTLSIVKIELMEEETSQEKIENDIYENDFSPLPNNNVEYSFEETSNTLFNTYGNPENTATNTNIPNNMFNSSTKFDNNFPNMYTNSSNIENTYSNMENTPSSIETTYTNMDNASTSMYSTSSNMGNSSTEMNYAANMDDSPPNMNSTKTNLNTTINIDNASTRLENPYNNMYSVGRDLNDNTTSNMGNIATNINDSPSNLENRRTTSNMDDTDIDNTAYDYSYENIEDYAKNLENNNNADNFYANNVENFARNDENYPAGVEHFDSNLENYTTNVENYAPNMNNATPSIANNLTNIDNSAVNILEESQPQDLSTGNSTQCQENETSEPNQITHAINASGISSQSVITSNANELVNLISQSTQSTSNSYSKPTSTNQHINVMTLQQALAQVLPPPLNQTSTPDNQMPNNHTVAQQVLHIVQGNNAQTVINKPNGTHLLHIVQNKNTPNANGLSLVDAGLQQGGNQLIHIVNNGNQNNAQFLKRVNLLTNLTNAQGSNEQKMIQFVCKSADGKSIQLNAGHQRSMVLRLHPTSVQTAPKPTEPQDLSASTSAPNSATSQDSQEIKSRSVYEENYAQFIQNSAPTPGPSTSPCQEKATSLPKFNQVFGKQSYQDNPNDLNHSGLQESSECPEENNGHLEQPAEANNPQLLVRNTSVETSQAPPNPVQQIKQTISPMNIHTTMHGGVIYTRQIPVNLGGGQTINLITVPSTEMVDETPQKQQTDGPFVNQEGEQSSIIKLVPHHTSNNPNATPEENNTQAASSNEPNQNPQAQPQPQPQPVLTQMRIKLPMLSKGPHIMPGTRLVRPSFFQIQRNVIAGTNQPVYQQLVLTTAPSLGQTIRLPTQQTPSAQSPQAQPILVQTTQHTQPSPHIPVQQVQHAPPSQHVHTAQHAQSAQHAHSAQLAHSAQHAQSAQQAHSAPPTPQPEHIKPDSEPDSELSTLTLEQLREFDMVLEQVKERSVQPTPSTTPSTPVLPKPAPADSTDGPALATTSVCESTQQVLYSSENNQPTNVVSYVNRKSTITSATTSFVRSPDSSGIVDTPSSSTQVQITHTVTSKSTTADGGSTAVALPKKKKKKKSSSSSSTMASLGSPTKTNSLKPQEDEQTTQRILYILAEYKEQVENSPDKNKPAPRRRNQFPPTTGSKRKRSHCSSRALCRREGVEMSPMHGEHGENGEDSLITLGSEDSSCGTTFSECTDCQESHSPEDSSTKVVRRLTFEHETTTQTITQTRTTSLPQRNVIVGDGQTITVARTTTATAAKPTTTVLMPANYLLPVSMIKGGQQIAIMTNRGPKILVGAGETNAGALLFQRLIGPGLKPVLARPGVRHIRLPATALHNLQAFNIHTTPVTQVQPPDSTASQAPTPAPPDLVDTRAMSSPWQDREARNKPDRGPSPDCTEPWNIPSSSIADDYGYEEIVRTDNMERTVLVVQQRKDGRHHRVTHVSTAALRHKYAILEHELRLQKSLSEECEDLGVDSPSASDLFPEADILFGAPSPAHEQTIDQCNTPPLMPMPQSIPQPDLDDQIATDQLLTNHEPRHDDLDLNLDDVGEIVTVGEDGTATIPTINAEEFARSHPNTTFHTEPEDGEITIAQPPFTIAQGIKGRHITFHTNRVPGTVVMAPQTTVISQATVSHNDVNNTVKFTDIDNMINSMPCPQPVNIPTVLVKDPGIPLATTRPYSKFDSLKEPSVSAQRPLSKFDSLLTDAKQSTNTARHIVHSSGHGTQVIRRLRYDERTNTRTNTRFHFEEPRARSSISDEVKMRNDRAMVESMGDNASSPGQPELFWDSTTTERHERRFHFSENEKVTKSPFDELLNDSSAYGPHTRLDSVIKAARPERTYERTSFEGISVSGSDESRPLRTYPPKRVHTQHTQDTERHFTLKTTTTTTHHHELDRTTTKTHHHEVERSGKKSLPRCLESEGRRRTGRGLVKRGCGCCNGMQSSAPPKKRSRPKKPPIPDFTHNN